ncbi:hypothetical protein [Picosynechococcus sp. PCC 11901]|nr:hypothetical protein [Picosynechococcus sp. PCC 11901]
MSTAAAIASGRPSNKPASPDKTMVALLDDGDDWLRFSGLTRCDIW